MRQLITGVALGCLCVSAAAANPPAPAAGGCPDGMRPVSGGAFKMGTAPGDPMMGFDEKLTLAEPGLWP